MRRSLSILPALLLAASLHSSIVPGTVSQTAASSDATTIHMQMLWARDTDGRDRRVQVDRNGAIAISGSVAPATTATPIAFPTALPTPAGGYASAQLQQTQVAFAQALLTQVAQTPTAVPTATPQARITAIVHVTFSVNTTPQAINLSSVAGVAGASYISQIEGMPGPCASLFWETDFSSTASAALTSGKGARIPLSTTAGVAEGVFSAGAHTKLRSESGTCDGSLRISVIP